MTLAELLQRPPTAVEPHRLDRSKKEHEHSARDIIRESKSNSSLSSLSSAGSGSSAASCAPPPLVGLGTFNEFQDADKVADAVRSALSAGVKYIDCASLYQNEKEIGHALKDVDRASFYVGSKLWCWDSAPEDVAGACRRSLDDLGVAYLDNYMMHWPVQMTRGSKLVSVEHGGQFEYELVHQGDMDRIMATYEAMERLVDEGLVRSLGVSNMGMRALSELLSRCRVRPAVLEVEMHPYLAQPRLLEFCRAENIHVVAYSPLGKVGYRNPGDPSLLEDPEVVRIAEETGRSPGQVLLRWGVQRGTSVIPKTLRPARIAENSDVLAWCLSHDQMSRLDALDRGFRFVSPPWCDLDRDSEYAKGAGHPSCQPHRTPCVVDENGGFHNHFERPGKHLRTDILVQRGVMSDLARMGKSIIPEDSHESNNYLVTDSVVDALYGDMVLDGLRAAGLDVTKIVVPAEAMDESGEPSTEPSKNRSTFNACIDRVLANGISKHSCIISLGGGVINNICGVMAATLYRGIKLVHFTTTSMGMLDAAIDFKQGINHSCGKNLIGAYYPADLIVMDPECIKSLTDRHTLNGIAEALKHGLTQSWELTSAIVEPLRENKERVRDGEYIEKLCKETIEVKVPTLTHYDESDFNEMVPQYGHAVAHAIEHLSWEEGHAPLLHGEAVAIGMCVTAEVAHLLGLCEASVVDQHYDLVGATGLPIYVPDTMNVADIIRAMTYDKHFVGKPTMGLCKEIGVMATTDNGSYAFSVDLDTVQDAVQRNMNKNKN